jgi:membrane associated rhomboid family serine protease
LAIGNLKQGKLFPSLSSDHERCFSETENLRKPAGSWLVFANNAATFHSMLSERSYVRDDYPRERTSVLTWLLCGLAAGFLIQLVSESPWFARGGGLNGLLALSVRNLHAGQIWTLVTHGFLHTTLLHLIGNLLMIYFLGRELLPVLGPRRFLGLFFGATILGGLSWGLVHWWGLGGSHIGATAAADALLIVYACFYPNQQIDFLLFFILPVSVKPKHLAWAVLGIDLFGLVLYEIPGARLPFDYVVANSAHLGGMAAGWIYYRFLHNAHWRWPFGRSALEVPRWLKRSGKSSEPTTASTASLSNRQDLRAEVDRILDKINSQGFGSLTPAEKRVLDDAKDLLSRR